jgi:hypothetical protein
LILNQAAPLQPINAPLKRPVNCALHLQGLKF